MRLAYQGNPINPVYDSFKNSLIIHEPNSLSKGQRCLCRLRPRLRPTTTTSEELINLFSDHDEAAPELNISDINNSSSSSSKLPIEWFAAKINGYYKNNLKIGHLNNNSIFGKSDEVVNLLERCAFDILFISESKIDGSVSSTLFAHAEYRIIRKDRKKEAADY